MLRAHPKSVQYNFRQLRRFAPVHCEVSFDRGPVVRVCGRGDHAEVLQEELVRLAVVEGEADFTFRIL